MKARATTWLLILSCAAALAGCEKAGPKEKPLGREELAELRQLPAGNSIIFGGNYMKLASSMSQLGARAMAAFGAGAGEWTKCFGEMKHLRIAGGVAMRGLGVEMRMAFFGIGIPDIERCAHRAGLQAMTDGDGKFVDVGVPMAGMTVGEGFLALPGGGVYTRQTVVLGLAPNVTPGKRAELEADLATLAHGTAADDGKLLAIASRVDRSQTFWFAGSGAGTPLQGKLGELYGSLGMTGGMSVDVTAQILDHTLADRIEQGVREIKQAADRMPPDVKPMLESLELHRRGDHLQFTMKLDEAQLERLMQHGMPGLGQP